ncbi:hypothetical protein MNEG_15142 [Monoraphidium neglectum]|uniref:Uncharacterized protein n=1 Tax=Monoraphidium neglectum TaxID=145388 RepID=A0A0D2MBY4_9CHLO|nr:hypothetical protein MNEG_15142 [Monoraphidium neglectum]KIY92820.1 hypothetical protein MNEG_15142 [Monoraphidium neglectum]|eukprot:XP_013891840.1 hypothetical protein MNEG_15142 [Monoraphidium neglectum]
MPPDSRASAAACNASAPAGVDGDPLHDAARCSALAAPTPLIANGQGGGGASSASHQRGAGPGAGGAHEAPDASPSDPSPPALYRCEVPHIPQRFSWCAQTAAAPAVAFACPRTCACVPCPPAVPAPAPAPAPAAAATPSDSRGHVDATPRTRAGTAGWRVC